MKVTFTLSTDKNYHADAITECYDGDHDAAVEDSCRACYDVLAGAAKANGLAFESSTDFGAVWSGTDDQIRAAINAIPKWADVEVSE